jgi:hypothetical protein
MMKLGFLAGVALLAAAPALAQTAQGGSPGIANSGPASTGTLAPTGTGAESLTNNPAGAGNAGMPSRAIPNTGRGSDSSGDTGGSGGGSGAGGGGAGGGGGGSGSR